MARTLVMRHLTDLDADYHRQVGSEKRFYVTLPKATLVLTKDDGVVCFERLTKRFRDEDFMEVEFERFSVHEGDDEYDAVNELIERVDAFREEERQRKEEEKRKRRQEMFKAFAPKQEDANDTLGRTTAKI